MTEHEPGFYAAIGMASQRDYFSLTNMMLELLGSLEFVKCAALHEVHEHTRQFNEGQNPLVYRRFLKGPGNREKEVDHLGFDECMFKQAPVEIHLEKGSNRLVFFVKGLAGPNRLVSVEGKHLSPHERVLLMNIISFYEKQVQLLDEKERDTLTGLFNRQSFDLRLLQVISQKPQEGHHSWLGCFDLDHFKRINDTYGHLFGDEVLLHFAQLMKRSFRFTDFLFRFGGEEFVVLFSDASREGVHAALERFREAVAKYAFPISHQVTVSIGFACLSPDVLPTTIIDRADQALYHAKNTGRNRVVAYDSLTEQRKDSPTDVELF